MKILRDSSKQVYLLYIAVIIMAVCVGVFSIIFFLDGAPREAMEMWLLTVILTVLMLGAVFFFGYVFKKNRVEFDERSIHIMRAFKEARVIKWNEIAAVKGSVDGFVIYGQNDERLFIITPAMINYELFYRMLREKCGRCFEDYNDPAVNKKKQVLKINPAYLVAAVWGIMLFGLYAFMIWQMPGEFEKLITDDSVGLFEKFFSPVVGLISIIVLIVALRRKVYYSKNGIIICPLFGQRSEVSWRELSKIEVDSMKTSSGTVIKKLIFSTRYGESYMINTMGFRGTEQYKEFLRLVHERKDFYEIEIMKH